MTNIGTANANSRHSDQPSRLRLIARIFGALVLVPVVPLIILAIISPITAAGELYLGGTVALVIGFWGMAWGHPKYAVVLWAGLGLIIVVAVVRIILLSGSTRVKMLNLPDENPQCWLNCILDEQDVALFSTRILSLIRAISPTEQDGLLDAMVANYQAMANTQSLVPSPFVRTYLQQQRPGAFDAVVIEPENGEAGTTGVIFLHGYTGNFTMPCWLFAQAVSELQGVTICPSVGWRGDWWTPDGEATLRATIDYLHKRGVSRIYLAGLSNGAVGASELAYKLTKDIAGLILVSGTSPDAVNSGLPVL